jgi:hypothetical protein
MKKDKINRSFDDAPLTAIDQKWMEEAERRYNDFKAGKTQAFRTTRFFQKYDGTSDGNVDSQVARVLPFHFNCFFVVSLVGSRLLSASWQRTGSIFSKYHRHDPNPAVTPNNSI